MQTLSIHDALKQYFGYDSFRPKQEEIIQAVMNGEDTLVLMPTGGGKSLCFQIPALVMPGMCLVVSPLIALMRDQVEGLKKNGVAAAYLNSSLSPQELRAVEKQVVDGEIKILYISPEKITSYEFLHFIKNLPISVIAIDEAHCISQWGHNFRPEYTSLHVLKSQLPTVPIIALTATADKVTRRDVITQLRLENPHIFISSFDRPNLKLTVLPGKKKIETIIKFIKSRPRESGIIYCLSRSKTEAIAEKLRAQGIPAEPYHAGLTAVVRDRRQDNFIYGKTPIIVATIAFGMGIDKPDVRWVIHYNLPKNIEGYYQEIGRAGRDGLASDTILFYSMSDVITLRSFIEGDANGELQHAKLERMQQYADARICRRKILLTYFNELVEQNCNNCDVCTNPPEYFDGTVLAQKALSAIARVNSPIGTNMLIDILRGSSRSDIFKHNFHQIKTYGAGSDTSFEHWQHYMLQMLHLGLIDIAYDEHFSLKITQTGKDVLLGNKPVQFVKLSSIQERAEEQWVVSPKSRKERQRNELFAKLSDLRTNIAEAENLPAYQIFSDTTLIAMAKEMPTTPLAFSTIPGIGDAKSKMYGERFIDIILAYIYEEVKNGVRVEGSTYLVTLDLYKQGKSPKEIAKERDMNLNTIYGHLGHLCAIGHTIDLSPLITEQEITDITKAMDTLGPTAKLSDIFTALKERIDYNKIRLGMAMNNKKG